MGRNNAPGTLNKYLYGNANPANYTDPTGNFSIGGISASLSVRGILGAAQGGSTGYSMVSFTMGTIGGYSSRQVGWLTVAAMMGVGSKLYDLVKDKITETNNQSITLYRAVEDGELASMYTCNCFSLGRSSFPKQFFHSPVEATRFGHQFIFRHTRSSMFHIVSGTISMSLYEVLDHSAYEPGIGSIATVSNGLLPAFNLEVDAYGGWRYGGSISK